MSHFPVVVLTVTSAAQAAMPAFLKAFGESANVVHQTTSPAAVASALKQLGEMSVVTVLLDCAIADPELATILSALTETATATVPPVIVVGANDVDWAVAAMKAGASDYWVRDRVTAEHWHQILKTEVNPRGPAVSPQLTASAPEPAETALEVTPPANLETMPPPLQASQHLLQQIAMAVPGWLYIFDLTEQRHVYINRQIGEMLGYDAAQIAAMGCDLWTTLMHPDDLIKVPSHFARFHQTADDEALELEYRLRHANGEWHWLFTREIVLHRQADGSPRQILGMNRNISGQKQLEAIAREHQNRFRLVTETIQDVFWISNFQIPQIFYVSPAYADIWGRSPDEVYQNYDLWVETVHPDDRERVVATAAQAAGQDAIEQEYRIVRPDGEIRWIRDRGFAVRDDDGTIQQMVGVAQDVTERRQAEVALAENEARLRGFVDSNVVGMLYGDIHGGVHDANDEFLRIVGYTREDLEAGRLHWVEMTPPEYLPLDERKCAEAQRSGACIPFEKEYLRQDGQRVPVLVGFSLLGERREQSVMFVLDLSSRKKAERALRRSQDRLRMALESAQLGTWDWHLTRDELVWDDRCKAIFGLPTGARTTIETFFQRLHPDDRERLRRQIARCLTPNSGGDYTAEYRVNRLDDGAEHWIMARGQVYFAADGQARRFIGTVMDITKRKRAETALQLSQERLQMAIEGSGSGFWDWHIATNEDYLSPEWLQMLGFDSGELPEKYSSWEKLIHPDDKSIVMEKLYAHLQDGRQPYQFEYRLKTKAGGWKWVANYGKVVQYDEAGQPLRMAGIHLDIEARKQAAEQLRLSEARYRTLANAVSQLMWISQADGQVEFFNEQWHRYTGLSDAEFATGGWPEVIHPDDVVIIQARRTAAIAHKVPYEVEARVKRHDQLYRWHLARVVPLVDDTGQLINWFGTATDIHDRKLAEAERENLLTQEQIARAAAERANRVKDEFLAILSHELRSPLNPILGWSQLLQTREFDRAKTQQALGIIERNAKLQTQLVDDLLDVAKILRSKLKLVQAPVDLSQVINTAMETVQTAAAAKAMTITSDLQSVGPIWGDEGRLQQIVWNLLSNAIKFTPAAGEVAIALTQTATAAQIKVTDTGRGIQPEFLPHLFESFRQEDVSITREYGGLGLGLAIVQYLVEAHGGHVTASSPGMGKGATFTVSLPRMTVDPTTAPPSRLPAAALNLAGIRILAVDDDPDCRDLLSTILKEHKAEVLTVASAKEALTQFHTFKPNLLISDLGMPQWDGYSLIKQIRSLSERSGGQIPAIALTAYTREEDQQKSLAHGFQRHVAKPIEVDGLVKVIFDLVNDAPAAASDIP